MRIFTFGELYGRAPCTKCGEQTDMVLLSADENSKLGKTCGPEASLAIIKMRLGKNLCCKCMPKEAIAEMNNALGLERSQKPIAGQDKPSTLAHLSK